MGGLLDVKRMFSSRGNISSYEELDAAYQQGIYRIIGGSFTEGFQDGVLKVYNCGEAEGGGIIIQEYVSYANTGKKSRIKWYNTSWTSWA